MSPRKLVARCWLISLLAIGLWAMGCASIVGADDYKVAGGGGGSCTDDGKSCSSAPGSCCSKICLDLMYDVSFGQYCSHECTSGADCASGCCVQAGSKKGCATKGLCADTCLSAGDLCMSRTDCCIGERCIDTDPVNHATGECREICTGNLDCPTTGCCAGIAGDTVSVCSPAELCGPAPPP